MALACHPTAPLIYSGCLDGVLRLWDLRTGERQRGGPSLSLAPIDDSELEGSNYTPFGC